MFTPAAPAQAGAAPTARRRCRCWRAGCSRCRPATASRPFESLIAPAEQMARFGAPVVARLRPRPRRWSPARCSPTRRARRLLAQRRAARRGRAADPARTCRHPGATPRGRRRRLLPGCAGPPDRGRRRRCAGGPITLDDLRAALPHAGAAADRRRTAMTAGLPAAAGGWRAGGGGCLRGTCRTQPRRRCAPQPARWRSRRAGGAAGRRPRRRSLADRSAAGRLPAAAGLDRFRHPGPRRQRGGLRAHHEQPVRHRPDRAGTGLPARRLAELGAAAAAGGRDRLERAPAGVPRRSRRLRPGRRADRRRRRDC